MPISLKEESSVIGRTAKDLKKYGEKGTAYLGKTVLSAGDNPTLGRKVLVDISKPHLVLICGKRGGGKCLHEDTLITLDNGEEIPIKELEKNNNKIIALNDKLKLIHTYKTEFYKREVNKLLQIKLRTGKEIKLTPEHPIFTIDGWIQTEELNVGSRIATPRKINFIGNEVLEEFKVVLLAYLIAEGHLGNKKVLFSNQDEKIIQEFKECIKKFDENLVVKKHGKDCFTVVQKSIKRKIDYVVRSDGRFAKGSKFNKKSVTEWLEAFELYNKKSEKKFIPKEIFKLTKKGLALFLNRYFSCDGTIYFDSNTKTYRISVSSASEMLARQLQSLLLRFEMVGVLRNKKSKLNGKEFKSFELELKGKNVETFIKEIGFYGKKEIKQNEALKKIENIKRNTNIDTIPREIWKTYRPKSWTEIGKKIGYAIPKSLRESIYYSPSRQKLLQIAKADHQEKIVELAESDIFWDEVIEIKELEGKFNVYDIVVPEFHNFVANNIIVHNSYSMSVVMEEFCLQPAEIRQRMSIITIDTVGIFWTLKEPNEEEKKLLAENEWQLEPQGMKNVRVLVPKGKLSFYKEKGLPVDGAFSLNISELNVTEWMALFQLTWSDPEAVLITRVIEKLQEEKKTGYGFEEIVKEIKADSESQDLTKKALANRFKVADSWGLFEKYGTPIKEIATPGMLSIIDVSSYSQSIGTEGTRDIVVAMLGKKLFEERMLYRKEEEINLIKGKQRISEMPIVWMLIDEAHMFMPKDRESLALKVLLEWVRVGRQPGLSLLLATQIPNKLHPDAISQCDLFISHRMTAQPDIQAVSQLRPSYLHQNFDKYYEEMPKEKGYALILDDNTERIWMIRIRPRLTWDGGKTASVFKE